MGKMFDGWTKDNLLDKIFSAILGVGTQVNRMFPSYQMQIDRKAECEKFYHPSSVESIRVPVLMLYPPEFTWESKDVLETKVEMNHLNVVSSILGQSLQLDWVALLSTLLAQVFASSAFNSIPTSLFHEVMALPSGNTLVSIRIESSKA